MSHVTQSLANLFVSGPKQYISKALSALNVIGAFLVVGLNYLLFPDRALMVGLIGVLTAAVADIVTRWLVVRKRKKERWQSERFWEGTSVKMIAYLVIAILAGASYRMSPLFQTGAVYLWSVAYGVMFLREVQSNMENLADLGADVAWLNKWAKRAEKKLLDTEEPKAAGTDQYIEP